jgi:putative nucleotidyltransferase with HDIG domain
MQVQNLDIYKQLAMARLPSLPQVLLELMELCDREDVGMAEIAATVAKDAGVAARIVGIANSPYYRPNRPLENLDQCLAVLGTGTVRRLALNQSVVELFGRFRKANDFDLRHFWLHALSVAVTARHLARQLAYPNEEEAYLAGLLHDVGQLALLSIAADRYLPMFKNFSGEHLLMRQEQAAFGLTHAEVGAWLAQRWNMHPLFVDSILYHHEPMARVSDSHPLVQIVMLANLCNALPEGETPLDPQALAVWKLDDPQVRALVASAQEEARGIARELGIELPLHHEPLRAPDQPADSSTAQLADAVSLRMESLSLASADRDAESVDAAKLDLLRSAAMLFGANGVALFMPEGGTLAWQDVAGADSRSAEIRIDPAADDSRIALAHRGRIGLAGQPSGRDSLADAQVLRILGGERLLCLPLVFDSERLGVLAIAMETDSVGHFASKQALLVTFAREAGKRLGEAIRQAGRIADARRFELHARKLAHEAGNPLIVIRNYLAVLREQIADRDRARQDFSLIEGELHRVARILQQFRQIDAEPAPSAGGPGVDVNALMSEVVQFCRLGKAELRHIEVSVSPARDLPLLRTDPDKLKQILTNLIFNAAEALPGRGRISLASTYWRGGKGQDSVELTVSDNGPGLPAEVLAHLYQPAQSRKEAGDAGLGLAVVGALVEELGGELQCRSSESGSHFKILLPATG